jgi:16S rRNA (uracil1498-N3)-methyltransferase
MRQFLLPEDWDGSEGLLVRGDKARYLSRVLRLEPGDEFPAITRGGERRRCRVERIGKEGVLLDIFPTSAGDPGARLPDLRSRASRGRAQCRAQGGRPIPPSSIAQLESPSANSDSPLARLPPIVLVQALPKANKMDLIVRQAAEAGIAAVLPLVAGRGGWNPRAEARRDRWERIAGEALQQSGSTVPTRIEEPATLHELPAALDRAFDSRCSSTPLPLRENRSTGILPTRRTR